MFNSTTVKDGGYFKYMISHAPFHYDKTCQFYRDSVGIVLQARFII